LKKDLKYSDGSTLNAKRFEYAFQRNIDPATAGEYASITDEILNAPEWRAADTAAADYNRDEWLAKLGVKASHADGSDCADYEDAACDTFTLTFSKPAPYFATIAGIWVGYPAKQELIEEGGELWWNSSKYQVGNGAFAMDVVEPFVRQHFVPNPNFLVQVFLPITSNTAISPIAQLHSKPTRTANWTSPLLPLKTSAPLKLMPISLLSTYSMLVPAPP
jgi:oligopeptide transport system substrate-binding protein